ncbi:uncharacterized protein PITG_02365 [Phytophthora infestans T30-4]|uniref:Tc1-like transposase DDE domain-containing protein n=1 Tax=Phytophthora infestans (strain T30-4) TaxID=403677 RepID=D0MW58_PHYIT|nr:uncharacterized protein PITG_02365 [Phytophthora infestans T30-4]EEY63871.1 conserved hypothetical protein [Phytophthora infestans T30-4]|eukprot:XP_002907307.1 conserved hypothetical protein [Phytophthora infestans T30-4]
MGMRFIKGRSRNIMAETTANVAFRAQYLRKKVLNLNRRNFPVRPEVYLDETFCNLHHVANLSWVDEDKLRYTKSGRGPRFCIIAAEVWQSNLKRKNDDDYHGNFNIEQFKKWFTNLSAILASKYGPCNIHMDGASYHKRQTNPTPQSSIRYA